VNKYREEIESLANKAEKLAHEARRVLGTRVAHGFPSAATVDTMVSSYSARLTQLAIDHDFAHLSYPKASHKNIVARALRRRRPFRENGTGYRDALLWSSILERIQDQPQQPIAIVTANTNDFGAEALHSDLRTDIELLGVSPEHVRLYRTLEELNHSLVVPTLGRLDEILASIVAESGAFSLRRWVNKSLKDLLWDEDGLGPLEPGHGRSHFFKVRTIYSLQVDAVRKIASDQILVAATADILATISIDVDWDDYVRYSDVREFFQDDDDSPFTWASSEANERMKIAFTLILSHESFNVLSSELDSYETDNGSSVEINPHAKDPAGK
jgi:hypothetical protein